MIKLPTKIQKSAFILKQYDRSGKYAIYEKILKSSHIVCRYKSDIGKGNITIGWEVIVIREQEEYERFDKSIPAKELYPNNNSWGQNGFYFNDFSSANRKYRSLIDKQMPKLVSA